MRRRLARLVAAVAVACFSLPAANASAAHVQCGAVLTQDTTLDGDVVCESGEPVALIVAADGLTLDLNGHRVENRGSVLDDAIGVTGNGSPRREVTIANGTITGFASAISFTAAGQDSMTSGLIRDATVDGLEPIRINGSGNDVTRSSVIGIDIAIAVRGSGNSIVDNDVTGAPGLVGVAADSNVRIVENRVFVPEPPDRTHNPVAAIQVRDHRDALIAGNTVAAPTRGIYVLADTGLGSTVIEGNFVTQTPSPFDVTAGIEVDGTSLVRRNTVTGFFDGIFLDERARALRNTVHGNERGIIGLSTGRIEDNVANGNQTGIEVHSSLLVRGNVARDNTGSGIFVLSEPGDPATVARNTANFNGRYGIEAQDVIDGGGNRAQGNAFSPQCLGVVCK